MSKIGKKSIKIPEGVKVEIQNQEIIITGSKGIVEIKIAGNVSLEKEDDSEIRVILRDKSRGAKSIHGTTRALIANAIKGVSEGWSKALEFVGTGYKAEVVGNTLVLNVGYSHPIKIDAPESISYKVEKSEITVEGVDKELVGQIAAKIRRVRPPEPYKGKGIKYKGEIVRRKPGKAARAAGTGLAG